MGGFPKMVSGNSPRPLFSTRMATTIDLYFEWSGSGDCLLTYLYVNNTPVKHPEAENPRGPLTLTVPTRAAYLIEWGLEFVGMERRNLQLRADFDQTGTTASMTGPPVEEKKHVWTGRRTHKRGGK